MINTPNLSEKNNSRTIIEKLRKRRDTAGYLNS